MSTNLTSVKDYSHLIPLTRITGRFHLVSISRAICGEAKSATAIIRENHPDKKYTLHYVTLSGLKGHQTVLATLFCRKHNKRGIVLGDPLFFSLPLNNPKTVAKLVESLPLIKDVVSLVADNAQRILDTESVISVFYRDEETGKHSLLMSNRYATNDNQFMILPLSRNENGDPLITYNGVTRSPRRTVVAIKRDIRKQGLVLHANKGESMYSSLPLNNQFITDIQSCIDSGLMVYAQVPFVKERDVQG